jgi:hypothetical protein
MTAPIDAVEFLDRSGGVAKICLCIRYADEADLSLWQGLNIGDEMLEVKELTSAARLPGAA